MSQINIVLDATMLDTFDVCQAKFDYRFNHNKIALTKPEPLDRGDLIHKGLEPYFNSLKNKESFDTALEAAKQGFDLAATESDQEPDAIRYQKNTLIENINYWRAKDSYFEILEVEKAFAYVLHEDENIKLVMIGKIDLLVNEGNYKNLPYDHKSYTRDYPLLKTANQFCNYAYACESNYLVVNRVGMQTSYPPEKKHKRLILSYDSLFLEQWKQNTIKIAYEYLHAALNNEWTMKFTSCDKYNRICEYHEVCSSSGLEAKIYKLDTNFKDTEKWDVSKSLGLTK